MNNKYKVGDTVAIRRDLYLNMEAMAGTLTMK
jgi:hypothetical protein